MAKKKAKSAAKRNDSRTPVQIRFDPEVHQQLVAMCDKADMSFNQLINGLARWAAKNAMPGELVREGDRVLLREQPGCISVGSVTVPWCEGSIDAYRDYYGRDPSPNERYAVDGNIVVIFDYTERRAVRED